MDVFVFASTNQTNIWAGYGAKCWAVSSAQAANKSLKTRAGKIALGQFGLFYCTQDKSITTPFVIITKPDMKKIVSDIWTSPWELPFGIQPIGSPHKRLSVGSLNTFLGLPASPSWNHMFHVSPSTAFSPSILSAPQWAQLIGALV